MERTLILIKPDALQRGLIGEITSRFEKKGLKLTAMKMMNLKGDVIEEHYSHLVDKPFFPRIKEFMQSSPAIAQCWEGVEVVEAVRIIAGITKSRAADAGTIRGDLGMSFQCNVVHASDSVENAELEVKRFFNEDELFEYKKNSMTDIYAEDELS